MRMIVLLASGYALVAAVYAQQNPSQGTISVCDLLRKPSRYNGKTIAIRGTYFVGGHGTYLKGEGCDGILVTKGHTWPSVIWLSLSREETKQRGLDYEHKVNAEADISAAVFRARAANSFKSEVAKVTLTYVGLFETRDGFDAQIGKADDAAGVELGFGDQGYAPAQLFVESVKDIVVELR